MRPVGANAGWSLISSSHGRIGRINLSELLEGQAWRPRRLANSTTLGSLNVIENKRLLTSSMIRRPPSNAFLRTARIDWLVRRVAQR